MKQIKARRGQAAFRQALRDAFGDQCVISGCTLIDALEAAHISPYRGEKDNDPSNGLLLRADLHTLFDLDLIGINPETFNVHVNKRARDKHYGRFHLKPLRVRGRRLSRVALEAR